MVDKLSRRGSVMLSSLFLYEFYHICAKTDWPLFIDLDIQSYFIEFMQRLFFKLDSGAVDFALVEVVAGDYLLLYVLC